MPSAIEYRRAKRQRASQPKTEREMWLESLKVEDKACVAYPYLGARSDNVVVQLVDRRHIVVVQERTKTKQTFSARTGLWSGGVKRLEPHK